MKSGKAQVNSLKLLLLSCVRTVNYKLLKVQVNCSISCCSCWIKKKKKLLKMADTLCAPCVTCDVNQLNIWWRQQRAPVVTHAPVVWRETRCNDGSKLALHASDSQAAPGSDFEGKQRAPTMLANTWVHGNLEINTAGSHLSSALNLKIKKIAKRLAAH